MSLPQKVIMITKICTKCGEGKKLGEFHNSVRHKNGKHPSCKSCRAIYDHEYYVRNSIIIQKRTSKWHESNKTRHNVLGRNWKAINKEKIRLSSRNYNNKPQIKDKNKQRQNKLIEDLRDSYIKHLICQNTNLDYSDVPDEIVRIHRTILKFKRSEKEKKDERNYGKKEYEGISEKSRRCVG